MRPKLEYEYIVFYCDGDILSIYLCLKWVSIVSGKGKRSKDPNDSSLPILILNAPQDSFHTM